MRHVKTWTVEVFIGEDGRRTHAEARLHAETGELKGVGTSSRHPDDVDVPEIGDEYAVGRALTDLGHKLISIATEDVEAIAPDGRPSDSGPW